MKIFTSIILFFVFFSLPTLANVEYIHSWYVSGGTVNKRTTINLTNVCSDTTVDATIKLFQSNGSLLSNQNVNGTDVTDSNGQIQLNLPPKQSVRFTLGSLSNIFTANGHAEIETTVPSNTESNTNIKCLIGHYSVYVTSNNNPYDGAGYTHLINQGELF